MNKPIRALIISTLLLGTYGAATAAPQAFHTRDKDKRNLVQFTSKATMESFTGRTSAITGNFSVNLDSLSGPASGSFEVDLNQVDTGIKMRNTDMRTKFLETVKYPKATFTLKRIVSADKTALQTGETANVIAEGDFMIHGVSRSCQIPVTLRYVAPGPQASSRLDGGAGALLLVSASWKVKLVDHNITTPQLFFMRVADEQEVEVEFAMTDQ